MTSKKTKTQKPGKANSDFGGVKSTDPKRITKSIQPDEKEIIRPGGVKSTNPLRGTPTNEDGGVEGGVKPVEP